MRIGNLRHVVVRNLVSPYGLALVSYGLFLFAWVFPPGLYTTFVHEPDLMFLDPLSFVFFTSCVVVFLFGVRCSRVLGIASNHIPESKLLTARPILHLGIPLIVATASCAVYLILMGEKISFFSLLASQQGEAIKMASQTGELSVGGRWNASPEILMAVLWWAYYRANQLELKRASKSIFYLMFLAGFTVAVLTAIATVGRTLLMPLLTSLFVIKLYNRALAHNIRLMKLAYSLIGAAAGVIILFSIFQYLRGFLAVNLIIESQLGYTIASYNRLAALLSGVMHYQYEGRGVYLSPYLLSDNTINHVLGLSNMFGWPDLLQLFQSETPSVAFAGLNPSFIWSGVFGYVYSDLGWWALLYLFGTGVLAGHLWGRFRAGRAIGIILYAWMAFWILFWEGWNTLFHGNGIILLETAILLAAYESVTTRRVYVEEGGRSTSLSEGLAAGSLPSPTFLPSSHA